MSNNENLIPMSERSKDEVREIGSRGGIASGKVRKEKATMKKTLEMLLDTVPNNKWNKDKKTYRELSTEGLMIGAVQGKAENYKTMLSLLGEIQEVETETPSIKIEVIDNSKLEEVMHNEDSN